jgi:biotin carboxyl carrier protein
MHMFSVEHKFYGGHGIVGAQVSLGTGLAFAHKYREDGGVCVAYFGDGAANQGQVYESFNMAELWKLPVIFVIENNQYAMGTSVNRSSAEDQLFRRGESRSAFPASGGRHGRARGARRDGRGAEMPVQGGKGPILLEMKTYRYRGHSMSDPAKYRSREEVQEMREKSDPIEGVKKHLEAAGVTEDEIKEIDQDIRKIVNDSADFAETAAEPIWASSILTFWWRHTDGNRIKMPALSPTMEEGTLAKWLVKEGDEVKSGDILAEIETDKATMEFEAVDEGTVGQILVPAGTEGVKVGTVIATMAGEGGEAAPSMPAAAPEPAPAPAPAPVAIASAPAPAPSVATDPAIPAGTEFVKLTVREALRDAMAEEMRADGRVFVMGEEVANIRAPTR